MSSNQLNIFSWQTDKLAEAWQQLAAFDFESCDMILTEILDQDAADEGALSLAEEKKKWLVIFQEMKSKTDAIEAVRFLLEEMNKAKFAREWGPMLLKTALQKEIIRRAELCKLFYVTETLTLADLYAQQHNYPAAEKILTDFIEENKNNAAQLARLADMQFEQSKFADANHNYMLALLTDPEQVSVKTIRNKKIADIIRHYGPEMAAAWVWLFGENVPLGISIQFIYSTDAKQKKAATACYLIMMAEKARLENNSDQRVEFRKKLHDAEPLIYQAYFNYCNTGKFLSLDEL
jgi:tetratricopeptide (TPR) repeat protein